MFRILGSSVENVSLRRQKVWIISLAQFILQKSFESYLVSHRVLLHNVVYIRYMYTTYNVKMYQTRSKLNLIEFKRKYFLSKCFINSLNSKVSCAERNAS
jgi:hypothetical protein